MHSTKVTPTASTIGVVLRRNIREVKDNGFDNG